ncbi:MAG TPA: hypothetical protein VIV40_16975 [Kofleriaceae bacterium]
MSAGHHLFACDGGIRYDVEIPEACALGGCGLVFAIPQRDAALRYWTDDAGILVEMDGGHTVTRYVSPSGTPLEFWEHDYAAGSFVLGGHCFPGGTDIGPSPLQFGCADEDTFVVGERVMRFFLDHPMP